MQYHSISTKIAMTTNMEYYISRTVKMVRLGLKTKNDTEFVYYDTLDELYIYT